MRVVIVEDQALLREGLSRLFADGGHEVVGTLGSAEQLQQTVDEQQPELVVIDVRMPPTFTDEGTRAAREIKERHPGIGVLVLSQHVETTHAVTLVTLGGFGYLLKDRVLDVADFLAAATRVAGGGSALDPKVVAGLVAQLDGGPLAWLDPPARTVRARQRRHYDPAGPEAASSPAPSWPSPSVTFAERVGADRCRRR